MSNPFVYRKHAGKVDLVNPTVEQIDVRDITETLMSLKRFAGSIPADKAFSVLEHSYVLAKCILATNENSERTRDAARWALWHDAPEAYISDVPQPVKRAVGHAWTLFETEFATRMFENLGMYWLYIETRAVSTVDYWDTLSVIAEVAMSHNTAVFHSTALEIARDYDIPYTAKKYNDVSMLVAEYNLLKMVRNDIDYERTMINNFLLLDQELKTGETK